MRWGWWVALALAAAAVLGAGLAAWRRRRMTPEERERRRRQLVNARGRIADALITDVGVSENPSGGASHWLHYSYDLRGVTYHAAQDITSLLAHLPRDPQTLAGPASVKYLPGNPSNSIVLCEEWSGLR